MQLIWCKLGQLEETSGIVKCRYGIYGLITLPPWLIIAINTTLGIVTIIGIVIQKLNYQCLALGWRTRTDHRKCFLPVGHCCRITSGETRVWILLLTLIVIEIHIQIIVIIGCRSLRLRFRFGLSLRLVLRLAMVCLIYDIKNSSVSSLILTIT